MTTSQTRASAEAAIAANIRAERARANIGQQELAERMEALGWKWVRQTVGQVEGGTRRATADELIGLALCLDIPVLRLIDVT